MDKEQKYIEVANQELLTPKLEVTKQYLAVMEVETSNGIPKIARTNYKASKNIITLYFSIKNEKFFIAVSIKTKPVIEVSWVWVESGHRVYLTATSKELTYKELANLITLQPLTGWSKGDFRPNKKSKYDFSRVSFEPNKNEAYELEEKLHELLEELDKNRKEVISLSKQANAVISVCKNQYISANAGIQLDLKTINRLQKLNLSLDIDIYIYGTELED